MIYFNIITFKATFTQKARGHLVCFVGVYFPGTPRRLRRPSFTIVLSRIDKPRPQKVRNFLTLFFTRRLHAF